MQTFNICGTSGHANVTSIGRDYNITYEIPDDATATRTFERVASIDERLKVDHDKAASTSHYFTRFFFETDCAIQ